jgi:hypothetical protein
MVVNSSTLNLRGNFDAGCKVHGPVMLTGFAEKVKGMYKNMISRRFAFKSYF